MAEKQRFIGIELSKTNNVLCREFLDSTAKKKMDDLTGKNGWIIGYIGSNSDRDVFQRDIEEKFMIRRSTVSSIIKLMEKKGFIRRESVSYDARLKKLVLTEKAEKLYDEMLRIIQCCEKNCRKNISDEELEVFFSVLQRIRENVGNEEGE